MDGDLSLKHSLIEVDDSVLIVIDVQEPFLDKLPAETSQRLIDRIAWLVGFATRLGVPLVVTAEDVPNCGETAPAIAERFPARTRTFNKMIFGLTEDPDILAAVERTGRKTAILVGLETDVCVTHSALGLLEQGYRVAVVADATGSPQMGQRIGLARMERAGVVIVSAKSLFYEWVRTVERAEELEEAYGDEIPCPEGMLL